MVEIKAKLTRLPVYFANEQVDCIITFTNNSSSSDEQIAWCTVQIHCIYQIDENKIQMPINQKKDNKLKVEQVSSNLTNGDTAFNPLKGERGQVLFSLKAKILFCDLKLKKGECQLFHFNDQLPDYSPPSFNGSSIRYFYKITIGIQRVNSAIQQLRMPFKVLNLPTTTTTTTATESTNNSSNSRNEDNELMKLNSSQNSSSNLSSLTTATADNIDMMNSDGDNLQVTKNNNQKIDQNEIINLILHKLDCLSSKRTMSSYIITNPLGKVAKFCLFKSVFKLGEDVIGFFDFSDSEIPCVQFTVTLQSEETINDDYKSAKFKNNKSSSSSTSQSHLTDYSQCQEFCLHCENTQISIPIPLTITPTFETKIVKLTWKLYFQFVITTPDELNNQEIYEDDYGRLELGPKSLNVQTMIWNLPITILPTNPSKIGQGLQLPDTSIITV